MLTWMDYVTFNRILITELDGRNLLKITQTYEVQMKTFEIRGPKMNLGLLNIKNKVFNSQNDMIQRKQLLLALLLYMSNSFSNKNSLILITKIYKKISHNSTNHNKININNKLNFQTNFQTNHTMQGQLHSHKHITVSHISHNSQITMHFLLFFICLKTRVGKWLYNI